MTPSKEEVEAALKWADYKGMEGAFNTCGEDFPSEVSLRILAAALRQAEADRDSWKNAHDMCCQDKQEMSSRLKTLEEENARMRPVDHVALAREFYFAWWGHPVECYSTRFRLELEAAMKRALAALKQEAE